MGGKFWLATMGVLFAIALAVIIVLTVAGAALATWGLLGAILVFSAFALGLGWFIDRRRPPRLDRV
jgi:hypothetical protein